MRPPSPTAALAAGDTVTLRSTDDAPLGRLRLLANATFVASSPSVAGRGLVLLTPIAVAHAPALARLVVDDPRVLNLACTAATHRRTCGSRRGDVWTVADLLPGEDVVAQVTLGGDP